MSDFSSSLVASQTQKQNVYLLFKSYYDCVFLILALQKHIGAINYWLLWQGQTYHVNTDRLRVPETFQRLDVKHWALKVAWKMSLGDGVSSAAIFSRAHVNVYTTPALFCTFFLKPLAWKTRSWRRRCCRWDCGAGQSLHMLQFSAAINSGQQLCLFNSSRKVNMPSQNCWNDSFLNAITSVTLLANCSQFLWWKKCYLKETTEEVLLVFQFQISIWFGLSWFHLVIPLHFYIRQAADASVCSPELTCGSCSSICKNATIHITSPRWQ